MPILYPVAAGTILLCDDDTGFRPPEMVKRRPVVVVSPRLPHRDGLATVVPLSTTAPREPVPYVCELELDQALPAPFDATAMWVKADMVATVAFTRLDFFRTPRGPDGKRRYLRPMVGPEDLARIRAAIAHAIGLYG